MKTATIEITKCTKCIRFDKNVKNQYITGKNLTNKKIVHPYWRHDHILVDEYYDLINIKINDNVVEFELYDEIGYIFSYIIDEKLWNKNVLIKHFE